MLICLCFILLTTAVGMAMGQGGAQAAKNAEQQSETDVLTLQEQLLNGLFPRVVNRLQNDVSNSYYIVPTSSGYQFQNSYNLTSRFRSKGVHLSTTDGSIDPFVQQARLTDLDSEVTRISDDLGYSVSVDGNTAVVGAMGDENNRGSAYVFTYDGERWAEAVKLVAFDGETYDLFGYSVSVDGRTIVVGAQGDDRRRGSAYVFTYDGERWAEAVKLVASDGEAYDLFGQSVSISDSTIVVGAPRDGDNGRSSGSVYVFTHDGERWAEAVKLTPTDGEPIIISDILCLWMVAPLPWVLIGMPTVAGFLARNMCLRMMVRCGQKRLS